eukprot:tig00000254_g22529.t1
MRQRVPKIARQVLAKLVTFLSQRTPLAEHFHTDQLEQRVVAALVHSTTSRPTQPSPPPDADGARMADSNLIRIKPYHYIHVLDNNSNVTRIECGPQTFIRQDHEKVIAGPEQMVTIPPRHYCIISNPIVRDATSKAPVKDAHGQIKLKNGDQEIRTEKECPDPFPLYPGEKLVGSVSPLQVIPPLTALRLRAVRDFTDVLESGADIKRVAGDEWLFEGPGTYFPNVAVKVVETMTSQIVKPNQALRLRARKACKDRNNAPRKAGEEWLMRDEGAYLTAVDEEVVSIVEAYVLTEKKALHLIATRTFTDVFGRERKAGEQWLVTIKDAETHIPDVYEQVVGEVNLTTLSNRQYVVVLDPYDANGKQQLGKREIRKGEDSFFLQPGERLEAGIQNVYILGEEEALLLKAREEISDDQSLEAGEGVVRKPGDRWLIRGPRDYVPDVRVDVVERRREIALGNNEGVYVRDLKSGEVRAVIGKSYMLTANEELWEKELPPAVEDLLARESDPRSDRFAQDANADGEEPASTGRPISAPARPPRAGGAPKPRDRTRVVTFRVPHNAAVQIYDYAQAKGGKKESARARVELGPALCMLGPDEQFTVLSISGGKPKKPNAIRSLALLLGPDFMTDIVVVETSDHTRLKLQMSYNWEFRLPANLTEEHKSKLFSIPDFVGDACKAVASRVRGAVATVTFDEFHRNSAHIIRRAVFGVSKEGVIQDATGFVFPSNQLCITNIDVQSVEPVDQKTREALQKSVQLAIEITTNSQEAEARQKAEEKEQKARGELDRQKIVAEKEAEKERRELLLLKSESAAVESTGVAKAEAMARADAANIEGDAAVKQARQKADALRIQCEAEVESLRERQKAELEHERELTSLEIEKAQRLAEIEAEKLRRVIEAIGQDTLKAIATAGPEAQASLLKGLNLQGFLITDGKTPVNLLQTAQGLIGGAGLLPH